MFRISVPVLSLLVLAAACGGGGGGGGVTPGGGSNPTPTPTPVPTATPSSAPQNYFPVNNQVAYDTSSGGSTAATSSNVLGTPLTDTSCSLSISATFGEYAVTAVTPLVSYSLINAYQSAHAGANPIYVITKASNGNVYIVGTATYGQSSVPSVSCISPYLWVRSQLRVGDAWNYTDVMGTTSTATVSSIQPSLVVTAANGAQTTYQNVATIVYGSVNPYTIVWVPGTGPVQTTNTVALNNAPLGVGLLWTAASVATVANSP
jgi:hypothetical protein